MKNVTVCDLPRLSDREKRVVRHQKVSRDRLRAQPDVRSFKSMISRRRRDAKHRMTTDVVRRYDILYLEDLMLRNMTTSAKGTVDEPDGNVGHKAGLNRMTFGYSLWIESGCRSDAGT